ncbi:MAG: HAMP domain-containing histidine kinase [Gemmatimonadaceae bacterium]|nr:HAMP domain-containing histidine kinase [Gemmatimonadaceae bacterium]
MSEVERERRDRLRAVGRVARGILHDVRNVVQPMLSTAFLLELKADDPAKVRELAKRIAELARAGAAATDRLREFVRQEAETGIASVFPLSDAVRDALAVVEGIIEKRDPSIRISSELAEDVLVSGDRSALAEAALMLLLNAVDAVPTGGAIRVAVGRDAAEVHLIVEDDGQGLTPGDEAALFDPFVSAKPGASAGVGLAVVFGIAERHGGSAWLSTRSPRGAQAGIRLPVAQPTPAHSGP